MNDKEEKGSINFQFLPKKYSKCPHCGALPSSYSNYNRSDWKEDVHFECGFSIYSKSPIIFEPLGKCKHSKEWKKTVKERLKQLEGIEKEIKGKVKDKKLCKELLEKTSSIKYNIERWWHN